MGGFRILPRLYTVSQTPKRLNAKGDKVIDTSGFDTKIRELEKQEATLRDQMEETCQEFLRVTSEFAIEWFQSRVQQEVTSRPKLAKQLGVKRLGQIKSELKALVSEAPGIVNKHINPEKYWAHRGAPPDKSGDHEVAWRYMIRGRRGPDELGGAVKQLLGYAGAILVKHRIANTERRDDWDIDGGGKPPRYKHGYVWPDNMMNVMRRYSELYGEWLKLHQELKEVQRERGEAEAKDLWDQV